MIPKPYFPSIFLLPHSKTKVHVQKVYGFVLRHWNVVTHSVSVGAARADKLEKT